MKIGQLKENFQLTDLIFKHLIKPDLLNIISLSGCRRGGSDQNTHVGKNLPDDFGNY